MPAAKKPYRRRVDYNRGPHNRSAVTQIDVECGDNGLWWINGKAVGNDLEALAEVIEVFYVLVDQREDIRELHKRVDAKRKTK